MKADYEASEPGHPQVAALRDTWRYATERSPYWRETLPRRDLESLTVADLLDVPPTAPGEYAAHRDAMRCRSGLPPYIVFTGGTTGVPRMVYGTAALLEERTAPPARRPGQAPIPLSLITGGGHHGYIPRVPGWSHSVLLPLRNRKNYEWAWRMLADDLVFDGYEPRISHVLLPLPALKKLVHFIVDNEYDTDRLAIKLVDTFSWYLSSRWRQRIANVLGGPVRDHYGFAEIPASATECAACGYYHYGRDVLWEAVDASTSSPVEEGLGRILVTTLTRMTDDHVLFRYDPGDLVRLGPTCRERAERGFRPCGRVADAVWTGQASARRCVLVPADVLELIDCEPWMARFEEARFLGVTSTSEDSFPRWTAALDARQAEPRVLTVDLELNYNPRLTPAYWLPWPDRLRDALIELNADTKSAVIGGRLDVRVRALPPGGIPDEAVVLA